MRPWLRLARTTETSWVVLPGRGANVAITGIASTEMEVEVADY